ncbi:glutathione synthase [Desulfosalsimonas propionicica]|uniref:Glutathione synthetase n=1 Tax=Desulfosalsimonas propionicica TaxID=332175 RepID=A0A7W0C8N6_9BACT|nr:glutathione synthase [Desulfosalsimonas propionicica]MBA2881197.1 glutathione synthase [Desulfosalsimonas propionicica]
MQIAFVMDRLEGIDPVFETTAALMYECNQRGHSVLFLEPHDIYVRRQHIVARMKDVTVARDLSIKQYWDKAVARQQEESISFEELTELDALFLRKDPPLNYSSVEFLAPIRNQVFMVNDPFGMVLGNSKLYTLNFPDLTPETHISRDPSRLRKIIDNFGGDMVIKPLGRFGGQGIIKVSTRDPENLNSLIHYYVGAHKPYADREQIMVQEYLKGVKEKGDVRILMLNGEILGAMCRKPPDGSFRTNIHAGGKAFAHAITARERQICEQIRPRLLADGLYFVGLDLIDEKLIEVNCVSPGGIPRINRLENIRMETRVIDFVEQMALARKQSRQAALK